MTEDEAAEAIGEGELIPAVAGSLDDIKQMRAECLAADIPVAVLPPSQPGDKFVLMVLQQDMPKVMTFLQRDWSAAIEREGMGSGLFGVEAKEGEEPPCPACGTAAPLVDGACSECGLQLE
jgi:hypothetical protein